MDLNVGKLRLFGAKRARPVDLNPLADLLWPLAGGEPDERLGRLDEMSRPRGIVWWAGLEWRAGDGRRKMADGPI